jgi:hypothetical protein
MHRLSPPEQKREIRIWEHYLKDAEQDVKDNPYGENGRGLRAIRDRYIQMLEKAKTGFDPLS